MMMGVFMRVGLGFRGIRATCSLGGRVRGWCMRECVYGSVELERQ